MQLNRLRRMIKKTIKQHSPIKPQFIFPLVFCLVVGMQMKALAHGVKIDHRETQAIEITALYDTGEPMVNAQVIVYAPADPSTPWMTATTTEAGIFTFTPDRSQSGNWEVAVRQAGHGEIINIPIGSERSDSDEAAGSSSGVETTRLGNTTRGGSSALSPMQRILMAGSAIWGFVGTALFFLRGKK